MKYNIASFSNIRTLDQMISAMSIPLGPGDFMIKDKSASGRRLTVFRVGPRIPQVYYLIQGRPKPKPKKPVRLMMEADIPESGELKEAISIFTLTKMNGILTFLEFDNYLVIKYERSSDKTMPGGVIDFYNKLRHELWTLVKWA